MRTNDTKDCENSGDGLAGVAVGAILTICAVCIFGIGRCSKEQDIRDSCEVLHTVSLSSVAKPGKPFKCEPVK